MNFANRSSFTPINDCFFTSTRTRRNSDCTCMRTRACQKIKDNSCSRPYTDFYRPKTKQRKRSCARSRDHRELAHLNLKNPLASTLLSRLAGLACLYSPHSCFLFFFSLLSLSRKRPRVAHCWKPLIRSTLDSLQSYSTSCNQISSSFHFNESYIFIHLIDLRQLQFHVSFCNKVRNFIGNLNKADQY